MTAVIYARYSSDSQREESIDGQIRECTGFAEKKGITVLDIYIDRALSAKTDNRPQFQKMIKDSAKRKFDIIIVWKLDRFARNRYDSARYKNTLKKNNVRVVSATENISGGSEGILLESVLEGMAEYYSAELAEKVTRGLTENALKCKFNGGTVPIGYVINKEQMFEIDPVKAPWVLEAFKWYNNGKTIKEIVTLLNAKGLTTSLGTEISINIVTDMLKNRRYIGEYKFQDILHENGIPQIVPIDLFNNVQEKLQKNKRAAARHKAEDDYLLKDRAAFEELYKPKMQYFEGRVNVEYLKARRAAYPDRPLGLHLGSVMGEIRNMLSVVGMSYLMCDDEDLFAEIVDTYAELQHKCAEAALESGVTFDFAHYWEDICFKNGPLLSPSIFEEICAKHYKKRNELCKKYGIDLISLDCDGVTERLLPIWFENGVNVMFPIEIGTWGDQFAPARAKYGKELRGVGAMDKTAFRKDKAAVDAEIERVTSLAAMGGFIPCPDHRLMPGSKFDLVCYYAEKIKEIKI